MESTISVLFPHELSARTAEVELHKRQRAELQANEAANRSEARRRLYSRIVSILERLRGSVTDELEQQQRAGAESPIENNNTSANTTTRVGTATQAQPEAASAGTQTAGPLEEDRGAAPGPRLGGPGGPPEGFDAPAAALARTLDNFMSSAMSSNAWQEGPPLLTLVGEHFCQFLCYVWVVVLVLVLVHQSPHWCGHQCSSWLHGQPPHTHNPRTHTQVFTIGRDGEDTPNESPAAPRRIPPHMLSSWRSAMAQNRARRGEAQGAQNPPRRSARLRNRRLPPGVPPFEEDAGDEGGEQ